MVLYYIQAKSVPFLGISSIKHPSFALPSNSQCGYRRTLRTEELSRDVQGLASHNDDLLAVEQLLSHGTG
jgi:hypothetical protein